MDISNTTSHTTVEPDTNPTFSTTQQMAQTAAPPETSPDNPAAEDLSAAAAAAARPVGQGVIRRRRMRTHVTRSRISEEACNGCGGGEDSSTDDEKGEVGKKIAALKRIVPGGERLGVEELFGETAEYILKLECQVKLLRFLAAFLQRSDEYKMRKHGS
ncbi:hypothetical protein ABFS83_08G203100 [Erythranthe nasuta]